MPSSSGPATVRTALALLSSLACPVVVAAQASPQTPPVPPAQTDHAVVNLPTTLGLGRFKSYTRITHRFTRDLRAGDFQSLAADLFSLDNGATIGLEYRFGVTSFVQAGVHRNNIAKTLQVFVRWDVIRQGRGLPFGISALASVEGLDNLTEGRQPAGGATVSRTFGRALALYAVPLFVDGTRAAELLGGDEHVHDHLVATAALPGPDTHAGEDHAGHDGTFSLGLGGRVRLLPSVFVGAEVSPRLSGHDPNDPAWAVSLEKRTRGHTLGLVLTNTLGTTPGQLARGAARELHLGFNLTRTF